VPSKEALFLKKSDTFSFQNNEAQKIRFLPVDKKNSFVSKGFSLIVQESRRPVDISPVVHLLLTPPGANAPAKSEVD
jgi:hypothetical protein